MINLTIILLGIVFFVVGGVVVFWSAVNTRNKFYNDFMKRKSGREKFRLP